MADTQKAKLLKAMADWKLSTAVYPFGSINLGAEDRAPEFLTQASSLLSMLAAACQDAQVLSGNSAGSEFLLRNANVLGAALEGIGSLVDLAHFLVLED